MGSMKDPNFLARYIDEANISEMLEAWEIVTLPPFLEGFALGQHNAMIGMTLSTKRGNICLSEAVQYLSTNYA